MAINGTNIALYSGSLALGSQRDISFDEATEAIDVSSKESRARRLLPGRYSASLSCDALYVPTDTCYVALKNAMRNGTLITVQRYQDSTSSGSAPGTLVQLESAAAIVTKLGTKAPDEDAAVISVDLEIDGTWS